MKFSSSKRTLGIYNKLREPPVKRFVKSTVSYCPKKKIGKLVTLYFLAQDHQDFGTPQKCLGPQLDQTCGSQDPDSKILMSSPVVKDPFPWTSPPPPLSPLQNSPFHDFTSVVVLLPSRKPLMKSNMLLPISLLILEMVCGSRK